MVAEADSAAECATYCAREEATFLSEIAVRNFLRTARRYMASHCDAVSKKLNGRDCSLDRHRRGISG